MATVVLVGNQIVLNSSATMDCSKFTTRSGKDKVVVTSTDPENRQIWTLVPGDSVGGSVRATVAALFSAVNALAGTSAPTTAEVSDALKGKAQIAALVSPTADYSDLAAVTAAVKSIVDALKA